MLAPLMLAAFGVPSIIPVPVSLRPTPGAFVLDGTTTIGASGRAIPAAKALQAHLALMVPNRPRIVRGPGADITLSLDPSLPARIGSEGYRLSVTEDRVSIRARGQAGLFYGVQTFRQLLPAATFAGKSMGEPVSVSGVEIEDYPRFAWRGAHLDVARNFMPKAFIFKFLDLLALHKLNVFHWHLTDDQGWRLEVKKYPRLTEVGSKRKDTMLVYSPEKYAGQPHEGYYTQDDVREVVAYAEARHITVVPEIEMPGHAQAAIAAYPELGTGAPVEVGIKWGVYENVFNVKDSTLRFLQDVLDEVMDLFPSTFIHVGGDECPKVQWKADPFAQEKMKRLGLKDEHELQSWFIRQMDGYLAGKGRRLIGWSEILEGGLAPGAALMVWLGNDGAEAAVKSGHDVVMAQTSHTYFDYYQSKDRAGEPHAIGGFLPIETVYSYEPILASFTSDQAKHVLGAQFQLWTEYIRTPEHAEYMAFPRGCALAEVVWSPKEKRNWNDFSNRLAAHKLRLAALGVNFRP